MTLVQRVGKAMKPSRRRFGHLEVTSYSGVLPPVNPALCFSSQVHFFKPSLLHPKLNGPHNVLGPWVRPLNKMGMALLECTLTLHPIRFLAIVILAFLYLMDEGINTKFLLFFMSLYSVILHVEMGGRKYLYFFCSYFITA